MLDEVSRKKLMGCHPNLAMLFYALSQFAEFKVTAGFRDKDAQDRLFHAGKSDKRWPNSQHNKKPAQAVDVAIYKPNGGITWNRYQYIYFAGKVIAFSKQMNVGIRWGGDWDMDEYVLLDQDFQDLTHFELI